MRITAGQYKNRKLSVPVGNDIRPTGDRARQSLFNMLHHASWLDGFTFAGSRVLDLFCGSGALGLEALSHGAAHCLFVDRDVTTIRVNSAFIPPEDIKIICGDATQLSFDDVYDLVFMDPPYRKNLVMPTLENLCLQKALADQGLVIIEAENDLTIRSTDFDLCDTRTHGQSTLHILRYNSAIK